MRAQEWHRNQREADDPSGTHLPFTAPLLSGVCVRANRGGLDFLLPNPSGGRGTYVVNWRSAAEYGAPTLHDAMLSARLAELETLDPPSVRSAARQVAVEGYAGRAVAEAAERGQAHLDAERLRVWGRLVMTLINRASLAETERTDYLKGLGQAGPGVMTAGLNALARRLGWEPATLFDALGRLSAAYAPLLPDGRVAVLLARLERMRGEISRELGFLRADRGGDHGLPASLRRLLPDLERCLRHGRAVSDTALLLLDRPTMLLDDWCTDPVIPLRPVQAVEQALDGWDRIAMLWRDCGSATARVAVLPELALLLRLAGDRIRGGSDMPGGATGAAPAPEGGAEDQDRGGETARPDSGPELVARNERVRALELDLEGAHA